MSDKKNEQRAFTPTPDCVSLQNMEREEFLSQLGNFSPKEREIFHRLCARWQPEIPYERLLAGMELKNAANELESLMQKLKTQRIGMITHRIIDGVRKPHAIIIASRDSVHFYSRIIEEYYINLQETLASPLPFESEISEQYPHIPEDDIFSLDYLSLLSTVADPPKDIACIYRIPARDNDALLATPASVQWVIHASVGKLRAFFANPDYLEMASRIQNCSMLEIKQKLNTRQPDFWKSLTSSLLSQETAISSNRSLRLGKRFFHICEIISRYVSAQMEMAEQQKQEKEDRDLDMKSIMQAAKDDAERLIPEERMQKMIDGFSEKYGKKFAEFKAEFRTRYMQSKAAVAPLTSIDSHWIHLDNLFPVFAGHMDSIQSNLLRHYIKVMERHLKTGNRINNEVFYSKENFEQDILRTIREMDGFLAESLERPNVISEALVHHLKRQGKVRSPEELRAHLMVFFHARTLLFLPLAEIFNLNLGEIFDRAFTHLPLWRQILIRVLGRYNTLQEKYIGRSFNSYKRLMKDEMKDRQDMMPERKADQQSGRSRADSQSRKRGDGRSPQRYTLNRPSRRSQSTHSSKPRSYNPNEREEAWRKFGETLNG